MPNTTMFEVHRLDADADAATLRRRSVRGAIMTFVSQGMRIALQFGSQIAMMRLLDPGAFGLIAMAMPALGLVQIFNDLGLTQATVQRNELTYEQSNALFWINLAISIGLALLLVLSAPLIAWFFHEPRLIPVTIALAALLVLSGLAAQQIALMNRHMRFATLATIDTSCTTAAVIVGIIAAWWGCGYWSLVLMQGANSLTITLLAWTMSGWRPSWRPRIAVAWSLVRFGGHLTGYNFLGYIQNNFGNVLLGRFGGTNALGLYDRAFKLVVVPWWQVNIPVARVADTLLARLRGTADLYARAHQLMLQGLLLVSVPGLVWTAVMADTLVPMVLGRHWSEAAPIVTWFALAMIAYPFGATASWLYVSQGRVAEQLRCGVMSTACVVVALSIGVHWGPVGMARCYAAFAVIIEGVLLWGATRRGPVTLSDVLYTAYPVFISAAVIGLALPYAQLELRGLGIGDRLVVPITLFASYTICGVCLLCFPAGQRIIRDMWSLRDTLWPAALT